MFYNDIEVTLVLHLAWKAGDEIMKIYGEDFSSGVKEDNSPITKADKVSNAIIIEGLRDLYPSIPFISEETEIPPFSERKDWERCWLIDPLDGTKEFIKKNGEFTVNIALIENGIPVLGVVYVPEQGVSYIGIKNQGSFKYSGRNSAPEIIGNHIHYSNKMKVTVVASRSHINEETLHFVEDLGAKGKQVELISSGSSLKFCLVAEGKADVYPRFGPTMEWDTAAAHAVALYAGKNVIDYKTKLPLTYNRENLLNNWFIVE